MSRLTELQTALRNADAAFTAADNPAAKEEAAAAARKFANYIREETAKTEAAPSATVQEMGVGERTLVGIGRGMLNVSRGVEDAWYRASGNADALSSLNATIESERSSWENLRNNSTAATLGEVGGEIAATLPLSVGLVGAAGKVGMGAYKTAALEGAIVEGVTRRGDASERLGAAGMGAGLGVAGQGVVDLAGAGMSKYRRAKDADRVVDTFQESVDKANKLQAKAKADGGFDLDMADATGDAAALREKSDIMKLEGESSLRRFMAQQEADIQRKASSFADETGGSHYSNIDTGEQIQELLTGFRNRDEAAYKTLYAQLDEVTGGQPLDTTGLQESLPKLLYDHKISAAGTASKTRKVLQKYGVIQPEGKAAPLAPSEGNALGIPMGSDLAKPVGSQKPLTAGNYEELIGELNDLYNPLDSKGANRVLGQTKELLEDWIDGALSKQGTPTDLIDLGRQARASRKAFSAKWEQGDAVEKMTTKMKGKDDFRLLPSQAVEHFTRPNNINDLKRLRGKLNLGNTADKQVWANMQQAPLLKAIQEATRNTKDVAEGGVQQFNEQAFKRVWKNSMSPEAKKVLYGEAKVKEIDDALAMWEQRGKRARVASDDNPSGTARAAAGIAARIFLPSGRAAGGTLAALPWLRDIIQASKARKMKSAGEALIEGVTTPKHGKRIEKEIKEALVEHYKGTDLLDYDRGLSTLARSLAREYGSEED